MATRPKASEPLMKKYGTATARCSTRPSTYRLEILAAMGLLGSCLTFPTERLYFCLMHVLVYLVRTKNLGITARIRRTPRRRPSSARAPTPTGLSADPPRAS